MMNEMDDVDRREYFYARRTLGEGSVLNLIPELDSNESVEDSLRQLPHAYQKVVFRVAALFRMREMHEANEGFPKSLIGRQKLLAREAVEELLEADDIEERENLI